MSDVLLLSNEPVLTPERAYEVLKCAILIRKPIMMLGLPGVGKSALVKKLGKELGRPVIDLRVGGWTDTDVNGFPYLIDKENGEKAMKFAKYNELPTDSLSNAIILFDEMNQAQDYVLKSLYELFLDRKLGEEYKLPDGVDIISAGNPVGPNSPAHAIPKALSNRMITINVQVCAQEWVEWATKNDVLPSVIEFIEVNPDYLSTYSDDNDHMAYGSPRAWVTVSDTLKYLEGFEHANMNTLEAMIQGTVGKSCASAFIKHYLTNKDGTLPSVAEIMNGSVSKTKLENFDRSPLDFKHSFMTNCMDAMEKYADENGWVGVEDGMPTEAVNVYKHILSNKSIDLELRYTAVQEFSNKYPKAHPLQRYPEVKSILDELNEKLEKKDKP